MKTLLMGNIFNPKSRLWGGVQKLGQCQLQKKKKKKKNQIQLEVKPILQAVEEKASVPFRYPHEKSWFEVGKIKWPLIMIAMLSLP
jgi:hypothetical protein